jgi:MFS family permease
MVSIAALKHRPFQFYFFGVTLGACFGGIVTTSVSWELYEKTHSPLVLGYLGLAQFLPVLLLNPISGHVVDKVNLIKLVGFCLLSWSFGSGILAYASMFHGAVFLYYLALGLFGIALSFYSPAISKLVPALVPESDIENALTLQTIIHQIGGFAGPIIAGFWIAATHYPGHIYIVDMWLFYDDKTHSGDRSV